MKNSFIILLFSSFLISCSSNEIDLDKLNKKILSYSELPSKAQKIYEYKSEGEKMHNVYRDYYSDSFEVDTYNSINNGVTSVIKKGLHHIIIINKIEFKINSKIKKPFVILGNKFYYTTELNLNKSNLNKSIFVVIDLTNYLKK